MTKRETKSRPIQAVHILFAALMLSMYLPGNAKVKASPVCMTVACVLIELAVIYQLIFVGKSAYRRDVIGARIFLLFCCSGRCIQRAFWPRTYHPRADAGSRFHGLLYHARANDPWRILLALPLLSVSACVAAARRGLGLIAG